MEAAPERAERSELLRRVDDAAASRRGKRSMDEAFERFRSTVSALKDEEANLDRMFAALSEAAAELHEHDVDVSARFGEPMTRALKSWAQARQPGHDSLPAFLRSA